MASTIITFSSRDFSHSGGLPKQLSATGLDYVCQLVAEVKDETTGSTAAGGSLRGSGGTLRGDHGQRVSKNLVVSLTCVHCTASSSCL